MRLGGVGEQDERSALGRARRDGCDGRRAPLHVRRRPRAGRVVVDPLVPLRAARRGARELLGLRSVRT